ncbi:MAG: hypothetical protein P1U46_03745 [Patescibacteria group bacterium]|nr:hypothetical protein [Patescibacteria group bacterium]
MNQCFVVNLRWSLHFHIKSIFSYSRFSTKNNGFGFQIQNGLYLLTSLKNENHNSSNFITLSTSISFL